MTSCLSLVHGLYEKRTILSHIKLYKICCYSLYRACEYYLVPSTTPCDTADILNLPVQKLKRREGECLVYS